MFSKKYIRIYQNLQSNTCGHLNQNAQYELHRKFLHSASVSMVIVIQNIDEKILNFRIEKLFALASAETSTLPYVFLKTVVYACFLKLFCARCFTFNLSSLLPTSTGI